MNMPADYFNMANNLIIKTKEKRKRSFFNSSQTTKKKNK